MTTSGDTNPREEPFGASDDSLVAEPFRAGDAGDRQSAQGLVPRWLAALVLILAFAVVLAGGFLLRGLLTRDQRAYSAQEIEIRKWSKRVDANPTDARAHLGLGYAYQSDGRYDKALEEYEIVLKSDPKDTAALYNRGNIYLKLGVEDRAEKSFWAVLDVDPTHELAAKALGEHYASKSQYKSLIAAVQPAAEAHPELADLQYLLGMAYEKLGDPATAMRFYRLAVKYSPDLTAAQEGLERVGSGK